MAVQTPIGIDGMRNLKQGDPVSFKLKLDTAFVPATVVAVNSAGLRIRLSGPYRGFVRYDEGAIIRAAPDEVYR